MLRCTMLHHCRPCYDAATCRRPNGLYNITSGDDSSSSPAWRSLWQRLWPAAAVGSKPVARLSIVHGDTVSEARQEFGEWATLVTRWAPWAGWRRVPERPHCVLDHMWYSPAFAVLMHSSPPFLRCDVLCSAAGCTVARAMPSWSGRLGPSPLRTDWAGRWCCW